MLSWISHWANSSKNFAESECSSFEILPEEAIVEPPSRHQQIDHPHSVSTADISSLPDCALRVLFDTLSHPASTRDVQSVSAVALASTCRRLDSFYREEYVTKLDLSGFRAGPSECARALRRYPRVTALDLWGCTKVVTDLSTALAPCLDRPPGTRLKSVAMPLTDVSDNDLVALVELCPELISLDVTGCDRLTDIALFAICRRLSDTLTSLKLRSACITDASGIELGALRNLTCLDLSECCDLTDCSFRTLASLCRMQELSLSFDAVTDVALCKFLPQMQDLKSLILINCSSVTSAILSALPESLVKFDLLKTRILDNSVAGSLFRSLPNLADFRTSRCKEFTDLAFMEPIYTRIRVLRLTRMKGLSDAATGAALAHMKTLEVIDFNHCPRIGDKTLRVAANLKRLSHLDLSHTAVTGMALSWIVFGRARFSLRFFSVKSCAKVSVCDIMAYSLRLALAHQDALICF